MSFYYNLNIMLRASKIRETIPNLIIDFNFCVSFKISLESLLKFSILVFELHIKNNKARLIIIFYEVSTFFCFLRQLICNLILTVAIVLI